MVTDRSNCRSTLCLILASSWVSMSLRQQRHLEQCPGDIYLMPVYVIFSTLFLLPIRLYGFLRMAKPAGWGTRANAYAGGEASDGRRCLPLSPAFRCDLQWTADESAGAGAVAVATRSGA